MERAVGQRSPLIGKDALIHVRAATGLVFAAVFHGGRLCSLPLGLLPLAFGHKHLEDSREQGSLSRVVWIAPVDDSRKLSAGDTQRIVLQVGWRDPAEFSCFTFETG